jgi:hypothetical protein
MNTKHSFLGLSLLSASLLFASLYSVSANIENTERVLREPQFRGQMMPNRSIFETYAEWQEFHADKPYAPEITEEQFGKLQEAQNLMKEGKIEEAKEIFTELNIVPQRRNKGKFRGQSRGEFRGNCGEERQFLQQKNMRREGGSEL